MNKTIKVNKRYENEKNGKSWVSIVDEQGNRYSVWDKDVAEVLREGVEATVDFYTKNGYHTISAIVSADKVPTQEDIMRLVEKEPMMKVADAYPTQPRPAPRTELPEVVRVVSERIAAYDVAAHLISAGNGEYKEIEKMADSALAYYYLQPKPKSPAVTESEASLEEYLRQE